MKKYWYLVYTKPRKEGLAERNLERQGYEVYLPLILQRCRRRKGCSAAVEPLFPRYLFVRVSPGVDSIGPIRYTTGVSGLVRFTQEPAVVGDHIIEAVRQRADPKTGLHYQEPPQFSPGDRVIIDVGPLAGVEAVFVAETGEERVAILLHMLGRETRVSAERSVLTFA